MDNISPTPSHRIRQFLASVDDYEALEWSFPLPKSRNLKSSLNPAQHRWIRVLHAMMMRKYFYGNDNLAIGRVWESIGALVQPGVEQSIRDEIAVYHADATDMTTSTGHSYNANGRSRNARQVVQEELYGRYLHGDHGKWTDSDGDPASLASSAFFEWCGYATGQLRHTRAVIDLAMSDGTILLDPL